MTAGTAATLDTQSSDDGFLHILFSAYLTLIPAGTLLLRYTALQSGLPMNVDRALFHTLNALTCTGFRASPYAVADFSTLGILGVYLLMSAGAIFSLTAGGLLVSRILHRTWSRAHIVAAAMLLFVVGSLTGTGFLMTPNTRVPAALFEATSALANAGLTIDDARDLFDARVHAILLPLATLGALGLPVIIELFELFVRNKSLSDYARRIIRLSVWAWMLGFGLLLLCGLSLPWRQNLAASWAFAVNARSLGMEIALPSSLPATSWWAILLLMLIGGAPASTAGGLRLTTLWLLGSSAGKLSAGKSVGRSLGIALFYTGLLLACAFALFLGLLATQPQLPADRLALIAVGALTNTGLSHNPLSLTGLPLYLLALGMLAGHLLPLIVAWWMKNSGDWDTPVC